MPMPFLLAISLVLHTNSLWGRIQGLFGHATAINIFVSFSQGQKHSALAIWGLLDDAGHSSHGSAAHSAEARLQQHSQGQARSPASPLR